MLLQLRCKKWKKFGKLYNVEAVFDKRGIAPKGFHIPTSLEYQWYNNPTLNEKGFNALPGGILKYDTFFGLGDYLVLLAKMELFIWNAKSV